MSVDSVGSVHPRADFEEVDAALASEDRQRLARVPASSARGLSRHAASVPQLLRMIGAVVLIAAALTFMFQHWERSSDVSRYFQFLGFTAVLCAAGLLCGTRFGDDRGARTFLALAAAAVPAHFTFLGALVYSQFPAAARTTYPEYAQFVAPSSAAAVVTLALGLLALLPIVWVAMLALARPRAAQLTGAYIVANALLLVPTRDPDWIAPLVLALAVGGALFDLHMLHGTVALHTREGSLVRLMLLAPLAVLVGRSVNLYDVSALLASAYFGAGAILLFVFAPHYVARRENAILLQRASVLPGVVAWVLAADALLAPLGHSGRWALPEICLPIAGMLTLMSAHVIGENRAYRRLAALVASGGMTWNLFVHAGMAASFLCLLVAIVTTAYGFASEERGVFLTGTVALACALLYYVGQAVQFYSVGPWGALAILGMATVFAATIIERHGTALRRQFAWLMHTPQSRPAIS